MNTDNRHLQDINEDESWLNRLPTAVGVIMVLLLVAYGLTFSQLPVNGNPSAWGTFGDYMGGLLNPIISLFTLIVAVRVWTLQKNELLETRKAVEEQGKTAEQQRQEQRFFDLLNVYYRTVENVSFTRREIGPNAKASERFEGKFAISAWLDASAGIQEFLENRGSAIPGKGYNPNSGEIEHMDRILVEWKDERAREYFDSYFRVVRHLLSEAQSLLGDQEHRYIALFCAQLSRTETILLALHLWLDPEGQEVQHLAGKYRLLKNLPEGDLRTELTNDLPPEVF